MAHQGWVLLCIFCLCVLIALIFYDRSTNRKNTMRMEKMRNSPLFEDLNELLLRCQRRPIEQITLENDGITVHFLRPAGCRVTYSFCERGFRPLSNERLKVLCLLIASAYPNLADGHHYSEKRTAFVRNQKKCIIYKFIMKSKYKDTLCRAPYYMQQIG